MIKVMVSNSKGSVCKSTISTHLAAGLAIRGRRVLVVDIDPQAHATIMLGARKSGKLYDLLVRDAPFSDVLEEVNPLIYSPKPETVLGSLYVLANNKETLNLPTMLHDAFAISDRLSELQDEFDFVIFDTSPTPSLVNATFQLNMDAVIYPTHCEYLSLDGLRESLVDRSRTTSEREQQGLAGIHVLGIVPTMYQQSTILHNENLDKLRERFGSSVWQPFPRRITWAEASQDGRLVFALKPRSKAAKDGWQLVDEFEERIEAWLSQAVAQ